MQLNYLQYEKEKPLYYNYKNIKLYKKGFQKQKEKRQIQSASAKRNGFSNCLKESILPRVEADIDWQ